jgi:hypothetical protein
MRRLPCQQKVRYRFPDHLLGSADDGRGQFFREGHAGFHLLDRSGGQGDFIFDQQQHYLDQDTIDGFDLAIVFSPIEYPFNVKHAPAAFINFSGTDPAADSPERVILGGPSAKRLSQKIEASAQLAKKSAMLQRDGRLRAAKILQQSDLFF